MMKNQLRVKLLAGVIASALAVSAPEPLRRRGLLPRRRSTVSPSGV